MTLAFAAVLIFVLYLVDKHKLWRIAFKVALVLFLFGALLIGGACFWYGYYEPHQRAEQYAAEQREQRQAEQNHIVTMEDYSACLQLVQPGEDCLRIGTTYPAGFDPSRPFGTMARQR